MGLILNEAVNNALKHAFPEDTTGLIKVNVKAVGNEIIFSVKDNGTGMPENIDREYKSLGLTLISGFSRELNAELDIYSNNSVWIVIRFKINC